MLGVVWGFMIIISVLCAALTGRMEAVSNAVLSGATSAVELLISMVGVMALWTGIMKIADAIGVTKFLANLFSPIMTKLFPDYEKGSPAIKAICMNVTANVLGLGNAATPMGIAAMKEMSRSNKNKFIANNSMVMFVVINTASIQLVPTMISILRQKHGAAFPFDVMPAIWLTSCVALTVGILTAKLLEK
ncbi:MAG: Spore maturation protein A [Eubacteriales bacterium SKADARSKE-1]|nr:Spore maturation protein A [Eubacteriales bacterium SKADARSKE-1]